MIEKIDAKGATEVLLEWQRIQTPDKLALGGSDVTLRGRRIVIVLV
jgi:hypothetical protein